MTIETLLAITIYFCIGHAWFAYAGNSPSRVLRATAERIGEISGDSEFKLSRTARLGILLYWFFIGPLGWPVDTIVCAYRGFMPKL